MGSIPTCSTKPRDRLIGSRWGFDSPTLHSVGRSGDCGVRLPLEATASLCGFDSHLFHAIHTGVTGFDFETATAECDPSSLTDSLNS